MLGFVLASLVAASPLQVQSGPLTLTLHQSEGAQVFHIVDQLSNWSPYSHQSYRKYFASEAGGGLSAPGKGSMPTISRQSARF